MKIQFQQLEKHLNEKIAPLYLISGDEFLLVQEACDAIRRQVVVAGYDAREVFYIESGFNWENFLSSANNFSLFSNRALLELRLKSKLSDIGSKVLQNYAKNPVADKVVLIIADKLDAAQQKTAWFKAIDTHGVVMLVWPVDAASLPLWITKRLQQLGLKADNQGIKLLADYSFGNLLAVAQEIEKLHLLYGNGFLTAEQIIAAITDNSRFNVFNLIDAAATGKISSVIRILENLKIEGVEPAIILWAIARELRQLINISFLISQGINTEQAMTQNNIWSNRKALIKKILLRHNLTALQELLKHAAKIDSIIKGENSLNLLWHELNKIYFDFSSPKVST